jgi:two-component system response regulator FixJ
MEIDRIVAVLDDDPITLMMLEYVLNVEGLETKCFSIPADFLKYMRGHRPACVLLDMIMPEMNGLQVLSVLAVMGSPTPVIIVSADTNMTTARTALNCGASSFISKPIDPQMVLERVRAVMAAQADRRESAA